jgi:predicted transcriptional regulator
MSQSIIINLPEDTKNALDAAASEEGLSESAFIEKALSDYLFVRRFRSLRDRMMSQRNDITDQDVFNLVS